MLKSKNMARTHDTHAWHADEQVMKPKHQHTYIPPHLMKNNTGIEKQNDFYTVQLSVATFQILTNISKY